MINPIIISLSIKDFDIPYDRLDVWVTEAIKVSSYAKQELNDSNLSLSRSRIKKLIEGKNIKIDGLEVKDPSFKIKNSGLITIQFPPADNPIPLPEKIDLEILYEDQYIIILNKQAGIVVHPAPGSPNGTLVNALLYHCGKSLEGIGGVKRPGIVHRLDKNTSGVMVVAKTETAHVNLCKTFSNHDLDRRYNAIVWGHPTNIGIIEKPIGRSSFNRKKMAVSPKLIKSYGVAPAFSPLDISSTALAIIREGMFKVTNGVLGTARKYNLEKSYGGMAGKTGTVQVKRITKAQREKGIVKNIDRPWVERDHALFVAYAPIKNPRYAISVIVEHGGSGSSTAAPIARDILRKTIKVRG